jgi:alkanesulfonate monooxygenase SsuD/methylene tetrahydromethanopterin reductase-like flavin-dependent oxidoreductase (luciferase family)
LEIALQTRGRYEEVLRAARWAEQMGLAAFAVPDHYLGSATDVSEPAWDHVVHLAGLARETSTIQLVDLVSPVTFRHPAVHAKMATTIQDMASGRFTFGLGTGWLEEEHSLFGIDFPTQHVRFEMLEEQLAYLHALNRRESFAGKHYVLEAFGSEPRFDVPLLTGGTGARKTPALAGRFCDELNLFPRAPDDLESRIRACHDAAREAGRNPAEVRLSFTAVPVAGLDDESYAVALRAAAVEYNRTPEILEERLAARGVPFGTPDSVRKRIAELSQLGISRLYLQAGTTEPGELDRLVSPYLG